MSNPIRCIHWVRSASICALPNHSGHRLSHSRPCLPNTERLRQSFASAVSWFLQDARGAHYHACPCNELGPSLPNAARQASSTTPSLPASRLSCAHADRLLREASEVARLALLAARRPPARPARPTSSPSLFDREPLCQRCLDAGRDDSGPCPSAGRRWHGRRGQHSTKVMSHSQGAAP